MRFGVIVFPGTNCDADTFHAIDAVMKQPVEYIWHQEASLDRFDCLILPGGFSYGDHLRAGAIARFSPVMQAVERFAEAGGLVLGICNGFQILTEAGLLPGALLRNDALQFRCKWVDLRVENAATPFTSLCHSGQVLRMPIAHGDGRYFADPDTLRRIEENGQVLLRYCAPDGRLTEESNPNGSLNAIAGICNDRRNVFGLMPHPERCVEPALGGADGLYVLKSILDNFADPAKVPVRHHAGGAPAGRDESSLPEGGDGAILPPRSSNGALGSGGSGR
ncbi:MAG: phosphoribosylformylglycinamidine synthase subunit PurQ [Chloroflexi bacterium]|nr:phosphoribosylformylglycinamidine synthase subunit PurQ [Chloroflexota bacterium]